LHPKELEAEGYLKADEAKALQDNDKLNDPKCTKEEGQQMSKLLNEVMAVERMPS
jgi:hypothetical protein